MMEHIDLKRLTDRNLYAIIILEIKKHHHTYRQKTNRSQDTHEFAKSKEFLHKREIFEEIMRTVCLYCTKIREAFNRILQNSEPYKFHSITFFFASQAV